MTDYVIYHKRARVYVSCFPSSTYARKFIFEGMVVNLLILYFNRYIIQLF